MRKQKSISRQMRDAANKFFDETISHDLSRTQYKRDFKKFVEFCRSKGLRTLDEGKNLVQEYSDFLCSKNKFTASTVHTYLAPVTRYYGISMYDIRKPIRRCSAYVRGRSRKKDVYRTYTDVDSEKWDYLVSFQRMCGARRSELMRITGLDYTENDFGFFVRIVNGKGGKNSLYYIEPENVPKIKEYFAAVGPNERIFSPELFKNNINLHRERARRAERLYYYFLSRVESDKNFEKQLRENVIKIWREGNIDKKTGKPKKFDYSSISGLYHLRGANRKKAAQLGKPLSYNKLCLKATSCMALGHYRNNISLEYISLYY